MKTNKEIYFQKFGFSKRLKELLREESQSDVTTAGRVLRKKDGKLVLYHNRSEIELESQNGFGNISIGDVVKARGDYFQKEDRKKFVAREAVLVSRCINPLPCKVGEK